MNHVQLEKLEGLSKMMATSTCMHDWSASCRRGEIGRELEVPNSSHPSTYLPYVCQNCKRDKKEVEECRVRIYRFSVFGKKCPKEREGSNKE